MEIWASAFADYQYKVVECAVKSFILNDTKGFAPVIGEVNDIIHKAKEKNRLNELEAWGMVRKAISNSIYHSKEEFDKLPDVVQKAMGSADNLKEWAVMDTNTVDSVIQSNFLRNYRAAVKRAEYMDRMPLEVKKQMGLIEDKGA